MKQSAKTAIGGMTAALSVVAMLLTIIPLFVYTLPAFAGILILLIVIEIDKKWAFGVYVAVSIIGFFVAPNKEAAVMYIAFFGYYPIVKALLESKTPRPVEYILKFLVFNVSIVSAYALMIKFMGLDLADFTEFFSKTLSLTVAIPILLVAANAAFIAYDFALTCGVRLYIKLWQPRFRRLFKL